MISKNRIKLIRSLEQKKHRKESLLFIAEGHKLVEDLLPAFECIYIAARKEWLDSRALDLKLLTGNDTTEIQEVSDNELRKASLQKNPQDILAIFRQRPETADPYHLLKEQLCIGLDGVQDPGNLGTIIRIADWFGIEHIFVHRIRPTSIILKQYKLRWEPWHVFMYTILHSPIYFNRSKKRFPSTARFLTEKTFTLRN